MALEQDMTQRIMRGDIPDEFAERERLFRVTDAVHPVAEAHFKTIAQKLLRSLPRPLKEDLHELGIDPTQIQLQFRLKATQEIMGGIYAASDKPLIVLSAGLWNTAQSEDELAGVLSHEINHKLIQLLYKNRRNKKLEELGCDGYSVETLRNAGYKQDALADFLRRLPTDDCCFLATVLDEHPTNGNRVRGIDMACNLLESRTFKQPAMAATPKNAAVDAAIQDAHYLNHLEYALHAQHYEQADPTTKLELLAQTADRLIDESGVDPYLHFRFQEIYSEVRDLQESGFRLDETNARQVTAFKQLVHACLTLNRTVPDQEWGMLFNTGQSTYYQLAKIAADCRDPSIISRRYVLGELNDVDRVRQRFISATSQTEAEEAARELIALHRDTPNALSGQYRIAERHLSAFTAPDSRMLDDSDFHMKRRKLPRAKQIELIEQRAITPSWHQHRAWAQESPLVGLGLLLTGIDPPRTEALDHEIESQGLSASALRDFQRVSDREYCYSPTSGKLWGSIYKLSDILEPEEEVNRRHTQALPPQDTWKEELGATNESWSAFTYKYSDSVSPQLVDEAHNPPITAGPYVKSDSFAQAFLDHITHLAQDDPSTYRPMVRQWMQKHFYTLLYQQKRGRTHDTQLAISSTDPYTQLALENPGGVLDMPERLTILSYTSMVRQSGDKIRHFSDVASAWPIDIWSFLGVVPPDSPEHARDAFHALINLSNKNFRSPLFNCICRQVAQLFMENHPVDQLTSDDLKALLVFQRDLKSAMQSPYEVMKATAKYVDEAATHALTHGSLSELAECYTALNGTYEGTVRRKDSWFTHHPDIQRAFEKRIGELLVQQEDPQQTAHICQLLLYDNSVKPAACSSDFKYPLQYHGGSFKDPALRNFLIERFAQTQATLLGRHQRDNDEQYHTLIDEITQHTSGKLRYDLLVQLAETAQTQRDLSYDMERSTRRDGASEGVMALNTILCGFSEASFTEFCSEPKYRKGLIEFLRAPLTDNSRARFDKHLREFVNSQLTTGESYKSLATPLRSDMLQSMHDHFWALSAEAQLATLEVILFPTANYSQKTFDEGKKQAFNTVLPMPLLSLSKRKDNGMARDILDAYFEQTPDRMSRAILSAMITGEAPSNVRQPIRRGKALSKLGLLGPAGDKFVQAVNSYPGTPEDIREDTKKSKFKASPPPRWDIHHWLEERGPDTISGNSPTQRVGRVCGSGSYGVTVELFKEDGSHTACTLLRPHARQRAYDEFDNFQKAAEKAVAKYPRLAPLKHVIHHARVSATHETDMDRAADQYQVAHAQTEGFKVTLHGEEGPATTSFHCAPWVGHGPEYKETKIAAGTHFNELAKDTPQALSYRDRMAFSLLTKELYLRFAGKPTDSDRHGGQQLIHENTVTEFDYGCQATQAPSDEEKRLSTRIIARALKANAGWFGTGIGAVPLQQAISQGIEQALHEHPEHNVRLGEMLRDLIAMSDYMEVVAAKKDGLQTVLGAVWKRGDIDPVIRDTLVQELGTKGMAALERMADQLGERITIEPVSLQQSTQADTAHNHTVELASEHQREWRTHPRNTPRHTSDDHSSHPRDGDANWSSLSGRRNRGFSTFVR